MSYQEESNMGGTPLPELSRKVKFRKMAIRYLAIAAVCLILTVIMYMADIGGAIAGAVSLAMIITFLGGVYYLIRSFAKK